MGLLGKPPEFVKGCEQYSYFWMSKEHCTLGAANTAIAGPRQGGQGVGVVGTAVAVQGGRLACLILCLWVLSCRSTSRRLYALGTISLFEHNRCLMS